MIRQWFLAAGKLVVLASVLVGTYGVFAITGLQLALKTREVPVPDLRGQTVDEATVALTAVALTARIEPLRRVHATIADAHVAEQDPSAGLTTRRRRSVKLWLSSGPTPGSVPTLIGETESGARRRLVEDSFTIEGVSEIRIWSLPDQRRRSAGSASVFERASRLATGQSWGARPDLCHAGPYWRDRNSLCGDPPNARVPGHSCR